MTTTNDSLQWPELYGFWIYGNGPSFVIWVEPASISETAGIRIGDRVVELDNRDVSRMSAHAIKYMARTSKSNPPAISVQSFSQEVELSPDPISGSLGLIVRGDMPVVVESVTPNSPAWLAGIRPTDVIIEVNNRPIKHAESLKPLVNSHSRMHLKYIPISRSDELLNPPQQSSSNQVANPSVKNLVAEPLPQQGRKLSEALNDGKIKRAQNFYSSMNRIFSDEPEKRKFIINELKEYTEKGDMNRLASSLNSVLVTPQQRALLTDIRPFIPAKQQSLFDHLTSLHNSSMVFNKPPESEHRPSLLIPRASLSQPSPPMIIVEEPQQQQQQQQQKLVFKIAPLAANSSGKRRVMIKLDPKDHYGFTLKGSKPVLVDYVIPNSIAQKAGLLSNDVILSINGVNVEGKNHHDVDDMLNNCESNPILEVMQKAEYDNLKSPPLQHQQSANDSIDIIDLRNDEGKTFKEKVKEVLSSEEKLKLKKILLDYNNKKDIEDFMTRACKILNTSRKRSLWFYLLPILEEEHQEYAREYIESNKDEYKSETKSTKFAKRTSKAFDTESDDRSDEMENNSRYNVFKHSTGRKYSKQYSSAPSLISVNSVTRQYEESELVTKFAQQLEYLLNTRERRKIKHTLKAYNSSGNIGEFLESIDRVLDTPAKRTLWFNVIPLLDEDDQEYAKRRLLLFTGRSSSEYNAAADESDTNAATPFFELRSESENDFNDLNWMSRSKQQQSRPKWEQFDDNSLIEVKSITSEQTRHVYEYEGVNSADATSVDYIPVRSSSSTVKTHSNSNNLPIFNDFRISSETSTARTIPIKNLSDTTNSKSKAK